MAYSLPLRILSMVALLLVPRGFCHDGRDNIGGEHLPVAKELAVNPGTTASLPYAYQRPWLAQLETLLNQIRSSDMVVPRPMPSPYTSFTTSVTHPHTHQQVSEESDDNYSYEEDDDDDYEFDDNDSDEDDAVDDQWLVPWEQPLSQQPREMSPVSQSKWRTMGTRSGVDELRRSRIASGAAKSLSSMPGYAEAVDHLLRVNRDGDCKVPKPRLVQVKQEYPHPSKIYLPRCTILHQCRDDTGCCNAESLTCVPRHAHRVDLFFYTSTVGTSGSTSLQRIERLSFFNHTECGCEDRNTELLPLKHSHSLHNGNRLFQTPQPRAERAPPSITSCRCPSKYAVRPGDDGSCTCDCFDKHHECLRLKKGKEYFNIQDRQCIQKGECKLPTCEFGSYLRLAGRCTKKRERFEAWDQ